MDGGLAMNGAVGRAVGRSDGRAVGRSGGRLLFVFVVCFDNYLLYFVRLCVWFELFLIFTKIDYSLGMLTRGVVLTK